MKHNIVLIDNRETVLRNQILELKKILEGCSEVELLEQGYYRFKDSNMEIQIFPVLTEISISGIDDSNKIIIDSESLEKTLKKIIKLSKEDDLTVYVVDLCLDVADTEIQTGLAIGEKIIKSVIDRRKCSVLYATGNATYWEPSTAGISSLNYAPRGLTSDGEFDDTYEVESVNNLLIWGQQLDSSSELNKMAITLLNDPKMNSQYFGAILYHCACLGVEG